MSHSLALILDVMKEQNTLSLQHQTHPIFESECQFIHDNTFHGAILLIVDGATDFTRRKRDKDEKKDHTKTVRLHLRSLGRGRLESREKRSHLEKTIVGCLRIS